MINESFEGIFCRLGNGSEVAVAEYLWSLTLFLGSQATQDQIFEDTSNSHSDRHYSQVACHGWWARW